MVNVSVPATIVNDVYTVGVPGAIAITRNGVFYRCPCGCQFVGFLGFRGRVEPSRPSWLWDGDKIRPTLTPSVHQLHPDASGNMQTHWHGYLKAGVWVPC